MAINDGISSHDFSPTARQPNNTGFVVNSSNPNEIKVSTMTDNQVEESNNKSDNPLVKEKAREIAFQLYKEMCLHSYSDDVPIVKETHAKFLAGDNDWVSVIQGILIFAKEWGID